TDGVRCTAGGEWADHLDCSHRPLLRVRRCGRSHKNCERGNAAPRPNGPRWQWLRHDKPAAVCGLFSAKIGDLPEPEKSADRVAFSMRKALQGSARPPTSDVTVPSGRDVEINRRQDVPQTATGDNAAQRSDLWPQERSRLAV